jgi:hypothetical protein
LKITEIYFKPYGSSDNSTGSQPWQSDLKIAINYTLGKPVKDTSGIFRYPLSMNFIVKDLSPNFGEFFIKTNNSKMPELKINGSIDGRKN